MTQPDPIESMTWQQRGMQESWQLYHHIDLQNGQIKALLSVEPQQMWSVDSQTPLYPHSVSWLNTATMKHSVC